MTIVRARWIACLGMAAVMCLPLGCKRTDTAAVGEATTARPASAEQLSAGANVYEMHCAQCHYAGEGGANVPPLNDSPVLRDKPAATFKVVIEGQQNQSVVNGQKFNGIMPAMNYLSDEEVASVTAYLRERFVGISEAIEPGTVAEVRRKD
jgi:mono/diheme cytochrome c family protein